MDETAAHTHESAESVSIDDFEVPAPGTVCAACSAPNERGDIYCAGCGQGLVASAPESATGGDAREEAPGRRVRCENCGSEMRVHEDTRTQTCPFCASSYVLELPDDATERQRPEFVLPFAIPTESARERFRAWLGKGNWLRPGDLTVAARGIQLQGIYLPFWSFSVHAHSRWEATIGEYWWRTETYTVTVTRNGRTTTETRTRQVQETEWWPLAGQYQRYHDGYLVSGSHGLPQVQAEHIKPFRVEGLKRYAPRFLAGWLSEEYTVVRDAALDTSLQEFERRQGNGVAGFLPGDTHRGLSVDTEFSGARSDLVLLPVYVLSYRYGEEVHRFLLNGQTGRAWGEKPLSHWRIAGLVAAGVLAAAAVAGLVWWLAS